MPRPAQPPTPASSTEIKSKDGSQFCSLQMAFELPPPAVAGPESQQRSSASSVMLASASSYYHPASPTSPAIPSIPVSEVVKIRRRSSAAQPLAAKDAFALPPPPTRSRKIIQMKPRVQREEDEQVHKPSKPLASKAAAAPSKKKQPSSTSATGRKIARKTAHSLIERRRRSKMNEEFGILKDMIPACTGEMHKLAILQASIDYVRYLEDCVAKLKAENNRTNATPTAEDSVLPPPASRGVHQTPRQYHSYQEQEDVEMGDPEQASPGCSTPVVHPNRTSAFAPPMPQDAPTRQDSYSSVSTDHRHYSFSTSTTTSPALGPATHGHARSAASVSSALNSPVLLPQRDPDHEATAALLMLNSDRRGTHGSICGRGLSVQDLLST
ncbi:helix-loop-helix DNA-binding domain-containing protein [Drepanopeziza brunnea f. sp. 'multigermtubi' MB_m1]|uniref:Helix-loop-helix DNA-binding domain-containing protein n=1 Tax=Marssonina brunnea f. sp. multigermtubi (strain MB_m1) TaxID=1072389 RepID=K1WTI2_MARBU|nr:helix-loop-helix DNA-binding domain-containing protein [Drepanopeziza brunnea f. sp. 'multigermtubi' MB_m1]EKD15742.1 helix-loop-helix DNA-binding domain-containing protein [Drepanopeziza brunnea f. sp. 'multigermtubi' MB_m1]